MEWMRAEEIAEAIGVSGATIRRKAGGIYKGHQVYERETTEEDIENGVAPQTKTLYAIEPLTGKEERHASERGDSEPPPYLKSRVFEFDALGLRLKGLSHAQIGEELDMSTAAVGKAIKRSMEGIQQDARERARELMELDLQRLDTLQSALWEPAIMGDDRAQKQVLAIMRHRAKIIGVTGAAPKNQWNIQINNSGSSGADDSISETPPGMLTPRQIRTYQDPAEAAKLEREIIKLQNEQLEYRERTGDLVEKRAVGSILHRIGRLVRDRLMKFPTRLANKLVGLDAESIARVLDDEVRDVLDEMISDIRRTMELELGEQDEDEDDVVDAEFVEASS